ncbi:MAG: DUF2147 domain-containing protein [Sphingobacteriales bacterium]|nr:MAG: DUF2147 domain-containing protein [Sphingobacteriales bacterium]
MISTTLFRRVVPALLLSGLAFTAQAQKDQIEGLWYNAEKTAKVNIFKAKDAKFYGNIVWLKEPTENGKPKTDQKNPKESLRNTPILNLQILRHFEKDGDNGYEDGEIYDPKNGKTYSCKITHKGNTLDVRGYVGISLLGRTTTWTRAQ